MGDRHTPTREPMGRAAVIVTATGLGLTGIASIAGFEVSASLMTATDGSMVVDVLWSILLIVGATLAWSSVWAAPLLPDPRQAAIVLERVGVLFLATGLGIFAAGVVLANGLTGTLMTVALVATAVTNLLGRQVTRSTKAMALLRRARSRYTPPTRRASAHRRRP